MKCATSLSGARRRAGDGRQNRRLDPEERARRANQFQSRRWLQEIVTKARQVDELIARIAAASQEQSQGISQVNLAITQTDKVTQSNAAGAEESASAANELNSQAAALKEAVAELSQLVGGTVALPQKQVARSNIFPPLRNVRSRRRAMAAATRLRLTRCHAMATARPFRWKRTSRILNAGCKLGRHIIGET